MATVEIRMPALGQSVAEGTVMQWLKSVGDSDKVVGHTRTIRRIEQCS